MIILFVVTAVMFTVFGLITLLGHVYSLNGIKSRTVGDGQHGTARWATKAEIRGRMSVSHSYLTNGEEGRTIP